MTIVTGANGFIGSAMVWELNRAGIPVLAAVDTISREERPLTLQKRKFDRFLLKDELWDFLNLPSTIANCQWIVHMGANSSTTETNWEHLYENNQLYTQRLFEWCTRHNKSLIYASSAATYGAGELGFSDATDSEQLRPLNLYGESKVRFDRWATQQAQTPKHWYGLKFFNVFGPNEYHKASMLSVPYKSYFQIRDEGKLRLFKSYRDDYRDGDQKRDFIYVKEVTGWMLELMQKTPASGVYNMGTGHARSWNDVALAGFAAMERKPQIEYVEMPKNLVNQYQYFTQADMGKWARNGLSPSRWPLEVAMKDYLQNYLSRPDHYL
jgi:ADP-L-glycero-D-manno-heptose 6-epimerase